MDPISLNDIRPEPGTFRLSSVPDKEFVLKRCAVSDSHWLAQRFPNGELELIFKEVRVHELCLIALHLMRDEDKAFFTAEQRKVFNEETGEYSVKRIGGVEMLKGLIVGYNEVVAIYKAINQTIGISEPLMDRLVALVSEEEKKNLVSSLAGATSSTPSPASTDTPSTKSTKV